MRPANAALTGGSVLAALLLAVGLSTTTTNSVLAQAGTRGQWRTLTNQVPINPIHLALLRTGEVLIVAGSGNVKTETNFQAAVWDPASQTFLTEAVPWDMFGNGMVTLPDGRVLINSGTLQYDPFFGEPRNAVFDPTTGLVTQIRSMAHGRWYPTVTTLGDGRVMTFSGLLETGGTNPSVEILTVGSGWSQEYPAGWTPPLYPRMHLGMTVASSTQARRAAHNSSIPQMTHRERRSSRQRGTPDAELRSRTLPLRPANGYRPRVIFLGEAVRRRQRQEIIDLWLRRRSGNSDHQ